MADHDDRLSSELKALFAITTTPQPSHRIEEMTMESVLNRRHLVKGGLAMVTAAGFAVAVTVVALAYHAHTTTPVPAATPTPSAVTSPPAATFHQLTLGAGGCCTLTIPDTWLVSGGQVINSFNGVNSGTSGPDGEQILVQSFPADATCGSANPIGVGNAEGGVSYPSPDTYGARASAEAAPAPTVVSTKPVTVAGHAATLYRLAPLTDVYQTRAAWHDMVSFQQGNSCVIVTGSTGVLSASSSPPPGVPSGQYPGSGPSAVAPTAADEAAVEQIILSATLTHP